MAKLQPMSESGRAQLTADFQTAKGGSFVSFGYIKKLTPNKDHKNADVSIHQEYANVYVGGDYQTKVAGHLAKAGQPTDYQVADTWGEHQTPILVEHNGNKYFECYLIKGYTCKETYYLNGEPSTLDEITPYVRPSELVKKDNNCKKQELAGLNESEQVKPRKLPIDRLTDMRFNGKRYE